MSTTPPENASGLTSAHLPLPAAKRRPSKRLQRIRDYEQEVLDDPDPLAASLGATNADMMRINHRLMKAINEGFARFANPLEDLPNLLPAVNVCSQFTRQIHRLAEFDRQLRGGATNGAPAAPRKLQIGGGSGTAPSEKGNA
jgi:hypothetical protein